ncbi:MAG: hypothetical protein NXI29_22730 [bacterium]|nr:hypothetical protein [bacterium]
MRSMIVTALLVLLAVVLLGAGITLSSEKPVRAMRPGIESEAADPAERDFFLAQSDERERDRRPEHPPHPRDRHPREHHAEHERHRAHAEAEHRNIEREMDEHRHRIQNMHVAAEHLEQAGMHDLAHRIHQEARENEQHLRERLERHQHAEHRPPHADPEVHELLKQLRNEVHELKREVRELRETVASQAK